MKSRADDLLASDNELAPRHNRACSYILFGDSDEAAMTLPSRGLYMSVYTNITMHMGENNSRNRNWDQKARSGLAGYKVWRA